MKNAFTTTAVAVIVAAAGFAAAPAFAESPYAGHVTASYGESKTRADVAAELVEFKKGPNPWSISFNAAAYTQTTTSRAAVKADVLQAHLADQGANLNGENIDFGFNVAQAKQRARASGVVAQMPAKSAI